MSKYFSCFATTFKLSKPSAPVKPNEPEKPKAVTKFLHVNLWLLVLKNISIELLFYLKTFRNLQDFWNPYIWKRRPNMLISTIEFTNFKLFNILVEFQDVNHHNGLLSPLVMSFVVSSDYYTKKLLEKGAIPNVYKKHGMIGSPLKTQLLFDYKADITETSAFGTTMLQMSCKCNAFEIAKIILEEMVKQNKLDLLNHQDSDGDTALHLVINERKNKRHDKLENLKMIEMLFNARADLTIANHEGKTPLDLASEFPSVLQLITSTTV